ncbi:amidohydrolase [Streptomyces sp. NPDC001939]|uniref:amidohydrolase n=1 Tax=unclassified Streptomyces TaxID=2593676 RepID=UPI002252EBF2|nr:amidohydrolase [Streptomyces sp. NBC_00401]MCX5080078.1 amidohydrolase [Streptomyces sp. NBC_00401]
MIEETAPVLHRATHIVSQSGAGPEPEMIAVAGGRIRATGTVAALRDRFPGAPETDHGDATLVPGLNDAHIHLVMTAEDLLHLDLSAAAVRDVDDLLATVTAEAARTSPGAWVRGSRYDDVKTGRLTRTELDRAAPGHPALVVHVAGHWGVVNSAALRALGVDEDTPDPDGGAYGRGPDGRLDGRLVERALMNVVYPATARGATTLDASAQDDKLRGLVRAQELWHAAGLTSVCDALVAPEDIALLQRARSEGKLSLRVGMLLSIDHYEKARALGVGSGFGDDLLRLVGVKAFLDGAVGGRTCLLSEPFADHGGHGLQTTSTEDLFAHVRTVHGDGNRVGVHANGDAAIRLVLDAFERAARDLPRPGLRHRIEHCSLVDDGILARMKALDAIAVPFAGYAAYHGGALNDWYGAERVGRMFAHRSFLDAGVTVAGSSDYPCGPYQPLIGLQSMVTREGTDDGAAAGPGQRVSAEEALRIFTLGSAEAEGTQAYKGRLAPGQLADFVALGENPLTADPRGIAAIPVRATYVGGDQVYAATGETHR